MCPTKLLKQSACERQRCVYVGKQKQRQSELSGNGTQLRESTKCLETDAALHYSDSRIKY